MQKVQPDKYLFKIMCVLSIISLNKAKTLDQMQEHF